MFHAHPYNLIVLSYHRFTDKPHDYPFSRTYEQFENDLVMKDFDWITTDDAHHSIIRACDMMRERNIRSKIFVPTALVGTHGYCNWPQLRALSRHHDIGCHSHHHVKLGNLQEVEIRENIVESVSRIKENIGYSPRWFVPPYNNATIWVEKIAEEYGMQMLKNRTEIKNNSR